MLQNILNLLNVVLSLLPGNKPKVRSAIYNIMESLKREQIRLSDDEKMEIYREYNLNGKVRKIPHIKAVKDRTGLPLTDCKEMVEEYIAAELEEESPYGTCKRCGAANDEIGQCGFCQYMSSSPCEYQPRT